MSRRTLQLVVQYDGGAFSGWQRQPAQRTVQGAIEDGLARLMQSHVPAIGAGRTDAGVHALGQSVSVVVPDSWTPGRLQRALNAVMPRDVRCAAAFEMAEAFHARYSATERAYRYLLGTDADAGSPFRYNREWALGRAPDLALLRAEAASLAGEHAFHAFAVKGTAPASDDHRCEIRRCAWLERDGGLTLEIAANRFLHHMVRFLVATMVEVGVGRRPPGTIRALLAAVDNRDVAAPAPACGLYLERVTYPLTLYLADAPAAAA
ncbi:MAG: tRNA pseudouridine(38-40) synthase TruA [Gemmatimonadaceae bacterium]|nr:tRNA pseudouridine(38-40) synthase TruA [Gemmatimonadaceae bacterium]